MFLTTIILNFKLHIPIKKVYDVSSYQEIKYESPIVSPTTSQSKATIFQWSF